jgi:hypothetical protein
MRAPLRILHVEDDRRDAALIQGTLAAEGIVTEVQRVDSRAAFLAALEQAPVDLILSDFTLPSFDGMTALTIAAEKRSDVPFLFVSGTLGEEVAIESLKQGATDYVLKHRLSRLGSSVQRALREVEERHERQRAQEALHTLNLELERRVRERTAQLEATNNELEAFSQSVSHDLLVPIRRMEACRQILAEDCGGQLSEQGTKYVRSMAELTGQMNQIVHDLLALARVASAPLERAPVDLSGMADSILMRLQQAEPNRSVEWVIAPGLVAQADYPLLRVAFENLLGNAWKFTGRQARARIEFQSMPQSDRLAYFVRDNGAGFDMAYASKLFGPFQRLHSPADFPGTGIGLATVQRIIHRHGGLIWAEAEKNRGATFYFTL